jgi:hypothetical protein
MMSFRVRNDATADMESLLPRPSASAMEKVFRKGETNAEIA